LACGIRSHKGRGFFTRQEQADEKTSAAETKTLDDYKSQALVVKSQCETWRQQWTNGQVAHTQQNADLIDQRCALYTQAMNSYNAELAKRAANASQVGTGGHPVDQERIASIAAETDWLHRARTLESMQAYPRAYNVIVALLQANNPIFAGVRTTGAGGAADSSTSSQSAAPAPVLTAHRESTDARDAKRMTMRLQRPRLLLRRSANASPPRSSAN